MFLTLMNLEHAVPKNTHFFLTADVASNNPKYEVRKVAFSTMFLKCTYIYMYAWGSHLFLSLTTCQKVLQRTKKITWQQVPIPNVVLTTQIYQDSSFPSATRQHWISDNLSESRIPQIWTKSKKLRKRANLMEKSRYSSQEPKQSP